MGRIFTVLLGLGVVLAALWYALGRPESKDPEAEAARRLENVHQAADRLEGELQDKADRILETTRD